MADTAPSTAELREAARRAIVEWAFDVDAIELVSLSENAVFRVDTTGGGRYALRIHRAGYNTLAELESELVWTNALRAAGIDVPAAIAARDGRHYVPVALPGWEAPRQVGMIEWINEATTLAAGLDPARRPTDRSGRFAELGAIIASLHNQAASWTPPAGFIRRAWDADGLVGRNPLWGQFWELPELSTDQRELLLHARQAIWRSLRTYAQEPATYSLIHADLHAHNVLVSGERLTVIDFDDAGFGWHQYDLAVALSGLRTDPAYPDLAAALIGGYRSERAISDTSLALLPVLLLVRRLVTLGWIHARPELDHRDRLTTLVAATCDEAQRYLAGDLARDWI